MSEPQVTVVIPVYNDGRGTRRSIRSVAAQTLRDVEIICVDDASTDSTPRVLEAEALRLPGLRIVSLPRNLGPLGARLAGVREAKGEYIAFLDCGDTLEKHFLQQLLLAAIATEAHITAGATRLLLPGLGTIAWSSPRSAFLSRSYDAGIYESFLDGTLPASMFDKLYLRRWLIDNLPPYVPLRTGEDYYFTAMTAARTRRIHLTDAGCYRWRYSGLGAKYYLRNLSDATAALAAVAAQAPALARASGVAPERVTEAIARKALRQAVEAMAEYLLRHPRSSAALTFASRLCSEMPAGTPPRPREIVGMARQHLRIHRKYYIFTRLLKLIYWK